jgi:hypothetical protein
MDRLTLKDMDRSGDRGGIWRPIGLGQGFSFVPLQLPLSPMSVFAIGPPRSSAVLNGVSENPRGYNDPDPEADRFEQNPRKNGNGGRQVASPAKAVPCGNERCKSKTKRCHEDQEKQVARENQHRVRQLPKSVGYFHILGAQVRARRVCSLSSTSNADSSRLGEQRQDTVGDVDSNDL